MRRAPDLSHTLTEAQSRSGLYVLLLDGSRTSTNARHIPYAEEYRAATGIIQSPIDRLQQAAEDEKERHQGDE